MNTEKTPTIYGTVTFEQFNDAIETVCKYVEGLANTYTIKDWLTEERRNKLEPDLLKGGISMMRVSLVHGRLIDVMKGLQAELLEKKAAKERAAQAETNDPSEPAPAEMNVPSDPAPAEMNVPSDPAPAEMNVPSEPAQAEPGNTYGPKTENL